MDVKAKPTGMYLRRLQKLITSLQYGIQVKNEKTTYSI